MATKVELIRTYLSKHAELGPSALAQLMVKENKGLKISPNEVSNIKSLIKKEQAQVPPAAKPATSSTSPVQPAAKANGKPKSKATAKKKGPAVVTAATNGHGSAATKPASPGLAEQVARLKAVATAIGKDEAKQILDLL